MSKNFNKPTQNNIRAFGKEITNVSQKQNNEKNRVNSKKYPKSSKKNNNIKNYPKPKAKSKDKTKKSKSKGKNKPSKNKLNITLDNFFNEENYRDEIIYNENPIEEYDSLIMKNLFNDEIVNRPDYENYFNSFCDSNADRVGFVERIIYINWIISITYELELLEETLFLAINLTDRYYEYLYKNNIKEFNPKTITLTSLLIASKYEEIYPPDIQYFLSLTSFPCSKNDIIRLEDELLTAVNFNVLICSPGLFLTKFFEVMKNEEVSNNKNIDEEVFYGAQFFLELCTFEKMFCEFKPSMQASLCLFLARKFLGYKNNNRPWEPYLTFNTGYSEGELKKNLKIPLGIIKSYFNNVYTKNFCNIPLYKKYSSVKFCCIVEEFKELFTGKKDNFYENYDNDTKNSQRISWK